MQAPSLMQSAKDKAPAFKRPDIRPFIAKGQEDAVERIVAAGMKLMYSPDMKEEVMQAIQSDQPTAQKLGENAAGIILTLDQQAEQGLPEEAMFPAGAELMSEAAEMLVSAGVKVTQDDWAEGFMYLVAIIGKKMGATDEDMMGAMSQGVTDAEGSEQEQAGDTQEMPNEADETQGGMR